MRRRHGLASARHKSGSGGLAAAAVGAPIDM
jgi:hypothetical protein